MALARTEGNYVLSQVVAYLLPEQAGPFGDRPAWDAMQSEVVELLEELDR